MLEVAKIIGLFWVSLLLTYTILAVVLIGGRWLILFLFSKGASPKIKRDH
jgi:hypothetical protein